MGVKHSFLFGVLLQSATEAKSFLIRFLREKRITPEEAAQNAAQYAGFFKNPVNKDVLHPISDGPCPKLTRFTGWTRRKLIRLGAP
jgi:hypothetical protein